MTQDTNTVYQNPPLKLLGYLIVVFGIGMVLYPLIFGEDNLILALSSSYSEVSELGAGLELYLGFSIIAGGLTIAMGILFVYVGQNYNPKDQKLLYLTFVQWFLIDSYASYYYGWEYNVILNVVLLIFVILIIYISGTKYDEEQ